MTGLDLVNRVASIVFSQNPGETLEAADSQSLLNIINDMLDAWAAQRDYVFVVTRSIFNLTPTKQTYTYGPGGDFNAARPSRIDRVSVITLPGSAQPLELPISYLTVAQEQAIPVKNVQSSFPLEVWDDQAYPLRNIQCWPIPSAASQLVFYPWVALLQFPDLATDVTFPPGYVEALKYNAAVRAAPEFGMELNPTIAVLALQSMGVVKAANISAPLDLRCDPAVVNPEAEIYNWLSDTFVSH